MSDEASEKSAPVTPKSRVNAPATTTLTASDRLVRAARPAPVFWSFRYRPRYAGRSAKPHGLKAATTPNKKAYTTRRCFLHRR